MTPTKKLKATSTLLLACLCLQAIPAQSAEIFFSYSTARKLYIDKQHIETRTDHCKAELSNRTQESELLNQTIDLLRKKATGLESDKNAYRYESDKFQALYTSADKERVAAITATPSRIKWFTVGAVSALLGVILVLR